MASRKTLRAARRNPDGSRNFDHLWQAIKTEVSRDRATEQPKSVAITAKRSSATEGLLPMVAAAIERDRVARERVAQGTDAGEPACRFDRAYAITRAEFTLARRRRGRR